MAILDNLSNPQSLPSSSAQDISATSSGNGQLANAPQGPMPPGGSAAAHLPYQTAPDSSLLPESSFNLKNYLAQLETSFIQQALTKHHWIIAKAARHLGLRRTTLVEKLRKYGIKRGSEGNTK